MSNTFASRAADTFYPPALASTAGYAASVTDNGVSRQIVPGNNVTQGSATTAAARSAIGLATGKKSYVTFQALSSGQAVYVAFKKGTAAASVTTTTGWEIPAGQEKSFLIDEDIVNDVEYITATGTGTLKWFVSSPVE